MKQQPKNHSDKSEYRYVVIYGYTQSDLKNILKHFKDELPNYIELKITSKNEYTLLTLCGKNTGLELLRFNLNKYQRTLCDLFSEELLSIENESLSKILGKILFDKELTISTAESCTGGGIANKIVQSAGSSAYFSGSVVSYSNEVKASVLNVSRHIIDKFGAVSKETVESMADGVSHLMHTDCAIATSGIAGPDGGTKQKPVGTVWIAVKYNNMIFSECRYFSGDRNNIMESAANYAMVMLIKLLRNNYVAVEDENDE